MTTEPSTHNSIRNTPMTRKASDDHGLAGFLSSSKWILQLPSHDLELVTTSARELSVAEGGAVIRCGDPAEHWFGLIDGLLVQAVSTESGRLTELTLVAPGTWFGEGTLLKKERWRYDALALRRSRIVTIPLKVFSYLRDTSIAFNHFLQELLNERLGLCVGMLVADRLLDPDAKVARLLAHLPGQVRDGGVFLRVRQVELAMLAGLSRQRTNMALNRLRALEYIAIRRDGICIRDIVALRTFEVQNGSNG